MFDEFERLCRTKSLLRLLGHYADLGAKDREAWQDRVMSLEGVAPRELSRPGGSHDPPDFFRTAFAPASKT